MVLYCLADSKGAQVSLVKGRYDVANIDDWKGAGRFVADSLNEMIGVINGNLEIGLNIKAQIVDASFTATNTDTVIPHSLGRVPNGYILINSNVSTNLYNGSVAFASGNITLKSTAVATTKILIL